MFISDIANWEGSGITSMSDSVSFVQSKTSLELFCNVTTDEEEF